MSASVGADAQRIVLSVHGGTTDVITQIGVPATTADYGALIPLPAQPTLDPEPVAAEELDALDRATAPTIVENESGGGGGCGCPFVSGSSQGGVKGGVGGVDVSAPVNIGPVTAVVLQADTGDALTAWLGDNGFALPPGASTIVGEYSGSGRYFVAIKRNDATASSGPTSIGVHFTMPGDQRALPFRFVAIGAAETVTFTVFVVAPTVAGPSLPFDALTLNDLDAVTVRASGYAAALKSAVADHAEQAFIVEGVHSKEELAGVGTHIENLVDATDRVTRLSTIIPRLSLTADVSLDQVFTGDAPSVRYVRLDRGLGPQGLGLGSGVAVAGALLRRRRRT